MHLIRLLKISDFITFLNAASGILCIFLAVLGHYTFSAITLFLSVIFDYFDGRSAKKRGIANDFGRELDSLCDIVSFGIAPVTFVFILFKDIYFIPFYIIFILAGLIRLARFNVSKVEEAYRGLPITINGIIIPVLYFLKGPAIAFYTYFVVATILMVSTLRFKKIKW